MTYEQELRAALTRLEAEKETLGHALQNLQHVYAVLAESHQRLIARENE